MDKKLPSQQGEIAVDSDVLNIIKMRFVAWISLYSKCLLWKFG